MYNTTYQQYMVEGGIQELTSLCITQRTNNKYMVEESIQELTSLCITQRTNNTWWRRAYKS